MTTINNIYGTIEIEEYSIPQSKYTIKAETIHQSLLKSLIPVVTPNFYDVFGNAKTITSKRVTTVNSEYHIEEHLLEVISRAVDIALENNWKYIHRIYLDTKNYELFVSGC
jgi:hypothetical protein